jgi:hypothetical protein
VSEEEQLLRSIAEQATRAEGLHRSGALSATQFRDLCTDLYAAVDLHELRRIAASLPAGDAAPAEPLDVSAVRTELLPVDCYFERTFPSDYAGFRIVGDETLVEFGSRAGLRQLVARARARVTFPTRVSAFAARFALVELRYAYVMLDRAWDALLGRGLELTSLDLIVERNRVVVGVEADVQATDAMLRAEFGPAVVAEHGLGGIAVG